MGKYPFGEYATRYMESMRGVYADETWKTRMRRYKRMERKVIELKEKKMISTMSPKSMTVEDVRAYVLYCKDRVGQSDLVHEVNALKKLLQFANNSAVDICFNNYPGLKPVFKGNRRKESMDDDVYQLILERSREKDPLDFNMIRAYTLVLMCINTGARNKEIRLAEVKDLDTVTWTFDIVHVKGEDSYGLPRQVPVHPDVRPILDNYLLLRKKWMVDNNSDSPALFPSSYSDDGFLSGNSLRRIKRMVEDDIGVRFDLRQCRRTFGQRILDKDIDIETVSVLMGHASTKTTEGFYSRRRLDRAMETVRGTWNE